MYLQPYGDEQQLNLNWIINEIINLHKQLDPDYETPSFTQVYPYSNLNRLNLDWVLSELKALKELAPEPTPELDIQAAAEALVALPFDSNTSYQINDFISRDGEIWRATEAIAAGGVWDETKWFKTKIGTDIQILNQRVYNLNAGEVAYDNNATYNSNTIGYKINNLNNAGENTLDDCNNFILGIKKVGPATLNMPENAYGFIESYIAQNNSWKWQLLITTQTPQKIFKRANINNTGWTEWVRIVDNTDIDNLNAGQVEYNSEGTYNNETVGKELQELKGSLNTLQSDVSDLDSEKIDAEATEINDLSLLGHKSLFFITTQAVPIGETGVSIPAYSRCAFINYYSNDGALLAITTDGEIVTAFRYSGTWINPRIYTLVSPSLTGIPTAPTAASGTNTTQIATTAFVTAAIQTLTGKSVSYSATAGANISTFDITAVKVGNVVNMYSVFIPAANLSFTENVICSNLPYTPYTNMQITAFCVSGNHVGQGTRLLLTSSGQIQTYYSAPTPEASEAWIINTTYICN